jgi:prevent-host-death family protein
MTPSTFTIAQARIHFPGLIHDAEKGKPVEITRRGKPVAVLVSVDAYRHLTAPRLGFWEVVSTFRGRIKASKAGLEPKDLRGIRETEPGREFKW